MSGSLQELQAQTANAKDDDAVQTKILQKARETLNARDPQGSITEYIDKVITFYENKYKDEKRKIYCVRTSTESLYYLLMAANEKRGAVAYFCPWADAYYIKGYALLELGKLQESKKFLQLAIDRSPRNSQYISELAHCYQLEKNWPKVNELFELAEESANSTSPEDQKNYDLGRALRGQGYVLVEMGKLDEAEKKYQQSLKLNPKDNAAQDELSYIKKLKSKS